jgi:uncharacterized protein YqeY
MTLKERISEDMKAAMRARETARLGAIRLLLAAIKQKEVDERIELDDAAIVAVIDKMLKQRRDSISQYESAGRQDLGRRGKVRGVDCSAAICQRGFPSEELDTAVDVAIAETSATGPSDMGKVMGILKPRLAGRADMTEVSRRVKAALASPPKA